MLDLTWWLMGKPRPVSVTAQTYRTIGNEPGHVGQFGPWDHATYTVEDFACGMVRFANGATMLIECGFNVNLDASRMGSNLVGDKGGASISPLSVQIELNGHITDCTPLDVEAIDAANPLGKLTPHGREIVAFCRSILFNEEGAVPGREAIWTQKIIHAMIRSAASGREVRIR